MSGEQYDYEFDPSGTSPDNKITGEQQVLSPPDWMDYYFIIPRYAPFFKEGLKIVHQNTGRLLVEGQDYHLTHRFRDASLGTAKAVFGSITFLDKSLTGAVSLEYQTLGGIWTLDEQKILQILSDTKLNPRITYWEQVAGMPVAFPPVDHDWHLDDLVGMSDVNDALLAINQTLGGQDTVPEVHLNNYNNPHNVTKLQVGLGDVVNLPLASQAESTEGVRNDRYMTPLRTKQLIESTGALAAGAHVTAQDNPHNVSKTQVGLGNVDNFATADSDAAIQGSAANLFMTPLATRDAIDQRVGNTLGEHIGSTDNPHSVTKTQVGLGDVENFGVATQTEAEQGTSNSKYMTPLRVKQLVDASVGEGLSGHANLTDNPHQVSKAQVGLSNVENFGVADEPTARAASATDKLLTVIGASWIVDQLAIQPLNTHINDTNNPHGVTATQVGLGNVPNYPMATTAEAQAATRDDRFMSPRKTFDLISQYSTDPLNNHVGDTTNPHGVTASQVGAYTIAQSDALLSGKLDSSGKAADSTLFDGRSFTQAQDEILLAADRSDVGLSNVDNTSDANKPVSLAQQSALDLKVNYTDVVNDLSTPTTNVPLSANMGFVLKGYFDQINALLQSDDGTLNELQEIVDFIKLNRQDLDSLTIASIAGLQTALDGKVDKIAGKGLSTEDYTTAEKNKLSGIQAGAQVNQATNLSMGGSGNSRSINSSTGSNVTVPTATSSNAGFMSTTQVDQLSAMQTQFDTMVSNMTTSFNDAAAAL